jgi:hypothetical protein
MAEPQPPRGERTHMTPETFTQQWAQIRQHLRGWWDQLTEHDLEQIAGQHDQLVRVIQARYQYLRERAQVEVDRRLQAYQAIGSPMAEALIARPTRRPPGSRRRRRRGARTRRARPCWASIPATWWPWCGATLSPRC